MINQAPHFYTLRANPREKDAAPFIIFVATINGKRVRKSIGFSIPVKYWNQKTETARPGYKDTNRINQKINAINRAMLELMDNGDRNSKTITPEDLNRIFENGAQGEDFIKYIERKAAEDLATLKIKKSSKNTYLSFARALKEYKPVIPINQVNTQFWEKFKIHLIQKGNKKNSLWLKLLFLKNFISRARKDGIIEGNPLEFVTEKREKTRRDFLTIEEINKTEKFYFATATGTQKNILRAFLFSCFTGLRISDIRAMRQGDIAGAWARITTQKNATPENIPLNNRAIKILQSGEGKGDQVFMSLNGQHNADLKKIFAILEIEKKLSFHSARHSFATNSLLFSGDIATVSKLLGHAEIKTTQIYAKTLDASKMKVSAMWDQPAETKKPDFSELLKTSIN